MPARSLWDRKYNRISPSWRGTASPQFAGVIEHNAHATNLDLLVDFSGAQFVPPASGTALYVRIYAISVSGSGKVYRGEWQIAPLFGIFSYMPLTSSGQQCAGGQQFILQCGGLAALGWGVEVAAISLTYGGAVQNVIFTSIAHGVEL